ncbi:hypothetical protein TNCV_3175241 [Trichonephila clavipes]|nr:hypothetical protein TNCV_3175241 [Trichonephila clavipes]
MEAEMGRLSVIQTLGLQTRKLGELKTSEKKKLILQEALYLLQNIPSESREELTDDSSDEEVPENNLLEFSSESEEDN